MPQAEYMPPLRHVGDHIEGRTVVGSEEARLIPLTKMNRVAQARQHYDEEDMSELQESLKFPLLDGRTGIRLVQSPTVAYFDQDQAEQYVEKANRMFDAQFEPGDLVPIEDGVNGFVIVLAGHRRTIALTRVASEVDLDPEQIDVVSQVEAENLSFRNAIALQYRENLHRRLPPEEDARVINAFLREGMQEGDYQGFADCARGLGVRPERVSRAFRFQTLPEPIREQVREKTLHFERAILLSRLCVVLAFQQLDDEGKAEFESRFLAKKLYLPDINNHLEPGVLVMLENSYMFHAAKLASLANNNQANAYVKNTIEAYLNTGQLGLVELTEEEIRKERRREETYAARDLAVQGLRIINATLKGDSVRVGNSEPVVLGRSSRVNSQLRVLITAIEAAKSTQMDEGERQEKIQAGIEAVRELAEETEELQSQEAMDVFSHSLQG